MADTEHNKSGQRSFVTGVQRLSYTIGVATRCSACENAEEQCVGAKHSSRPVRLQAADAMDDDTKLFSPENMESAGFAFLEALNYPPSALGAGSLGPSSLESVVRFCQELHALLSTGTNVCVFCSAFPGVLANTLLLLGAYLIMFCGKAADDAAQELGVRAAVHRYPAPWSPISRWHEHSLNVLECLRGLEVAMKLGWLQTHFDHSLWRSLLRTHDASAVMSISLSSGKKLQIWAMADPVTTVADPTVRPLPPEEGFLSDYETVKEVTVFLSETDPEHTPTKKWMLQREGSEPVGTAASEPLGAAARGRERLEIDESPVSRPSQTSIISKGTMSSQHSSTNYNKNSSWLEMVRVRRFGRTHHQTASNVPFKLLKSRGLLTMPEIGSWLKSVTCQRLVRLNFSDDRNLPKGGSYSDYFKHWGIQQEDIAFADGTAPPEAIVARFHELVDMVEQQLESDQFENEYSIVVHCTAGLGRTMTLIGSLAVKRLGVSGGSWLGWARLVRPGSVQTLDQERYLKLLRPGQDSSVPAACVPCLRLFQRLQTT